MIAVTPMLLHSSHQHSPIAPDHGRPSRSITALPFALVARAPVRPSPTRCSYFGHCTRSRGHHVTVAQPCVMQATSSAIHLIGHPPHQPSTSSAIHLIGHPPHQPATSAAIHLISHPPHRPSTSAADMGFGGSNPRFM